jgi:predicted Rossmann fold flavoprotein
MPTDVDIAIVGAGAAGLAAGIFAAQTQPQLNITLLDGARTIGAKILVSGGGRCNVTHKRVTPSDFHAPRRIVEKILRRFDEHETVDWFESMGVPLKEEPTGKLFPVSNTARTVLDALLHRCHELGVTLLTQHRVNEIAPTKTGFQVLHEGGQLNAARVIMATGGQSLPKSGSDGHGWSIVRQLGHTVTPTYPALVPLILHDSFFHRGLAGTSHETTVITRVGNVIVDRRTGSLLWTHFGVSGPVVLDASRFWAIANGQDQMAKVSLGFFPEKTFEDVDRWLSDATRHPGNKRVLTLLSQTLPNRVAKAICAYVEGLQQPPPNEPPSGPTASDIGTLPLNKLPRPQRRALAQALIDLPLPVVGTRGWNYAEVTAGGVPLSEVNPSSMISRKIPGLFLIGEILDCDGRIGGFNFQWAWTTGFIAGCSSASD